MKLNADDIKKLLLDIFYPNRCPCCNDFITWNELICSKCTDDIDNMENAYFCKQCGRNPCICSSNLFYDDAFVYKPYDGTVKNGVLSMKRGNNTNFGRYTGMKLAEMIGNTEADFIIPVPMAKKKKRVRGYNQAEVIADKISEILGIPVKNNILNMRYSKTEQHSRNSKERMLIENYLDISDIDLTDKKIILCDDIITTSSTVNACSKLLKSKGAVYVTVALSAGTILKTD